MKIHSMSTPIVHRSSVHQLQTRLLFKFQRPDASAFGKLCAVPCHGFVSDNTSTLQCYSDLPIVADVGLKTKELPVTMSTEGPRSPQQIIISQIQNAYS